MRVECVYQLGAIVCCTVEMNVNMMLKGVSEDEGCQNPV